jgi:hypothetical protein
MALPRAAIRRRSSVVALPTACQRLFDILLRASTRVDNLDDMHDAICHAAARFRHDASARCFVAHRHNLDVKCRFLRAATPFQLPLFNFFVGVLPIADRCRRRSSTATGHEACCVTVEKFLINVCDFDLETYATSSTSSVTCTFVAAVAPHSPSRLFNVTLIDDVWFVTTACEAIAL